EEIGQRLQMDMETIHRYKQLTGIAELFKNAAYSTAWSMEEI
ncbi:MAG: chromosome partitioning protein ParB, partial [Caulobacteraceae bacterium]|nr:chromosome partitioning protein ParB [Caulobacteraceae bacterium]